MGWGEQRMSWGKLTPTWVKVFAAAVLAASLFSGCGADAPFTLVEPKPPTNPGGNVPPPGGNKGGCLINFTSTALLKAQGGGDTGIAESDPQSLPAIPIRFSFNGDQATATMSPDDFPSNVVISLKGIPLTVRQKAGPDASGSFNPADGSLNIDGITFAITSDLADFDLVGLNLTTGEHEQEGAFGNLTIEGSPLASDKHIKLVGGVKIPAGAIPGFPDFDEAAMVVSFDGSFDNVPDAANCSGSAASGVIVKEVATDKDGHPIEVSLAANNTLNMGSVFVAQAGTDSPAPTDTKFFKKKTLRVKNNTAAAISGTVNSPNGYTVTPNGSISIAAGAAQDFQVTFGFAPVSDYSETNVPLTKNVTGSFTLGTTTVNLTGVAKRAGPELTIEGAETSNPVTVNLGVAPVFTTGSGTSTKLLCPPPNGIPLLARKMTIKNTGIRPLDIQHINAPADSDTDSAADPGCVSYGQEFQRMSLSVADGATCEQKTISGVKWLTDHCTIPVGEGKVNFKVVYLPKNASSLRDESQDTGTMTIPSNDPIYSEEPFTLNLQGAVSKDTSDLLAVRRQGSTFTVRNGGNLSMNISETSATKLDQVFELLNSSSDRLQNVQFTLAGDSAEHFELCNPDFSNCAAENPGIVTEIPGMTGTNPGVSPFAVRFKKPGSGNGPFTATLTVQYVPESTKTGSNPQGVTNQFVVNLSGTVGFNPLHDKVKMEVDFISSYIAPSPVTTPTDSLDFRNLPSNKSFLKSGALILNITPFDAADPGNPIRNVEVVDMPFPADGANALQFLTGLSATDRSKLIRVFTSRMSTCGPADSDNCPVDGTPNCTEPSNISGAYQNGKCSYFYYLLRNKPGQFGKYNVETGELTLPDLDIHLLNPFHKTLASYTSDKKTDTELLGTLTTLTVNAKVLRLPDFGGDSVPIILDPDIAALTIPSSTVGTFDACPDNWDPSNAAQTPEFRCYLSQTSSSSDAFIKGLSGRWIAPGKQTMILSMLTQFNANQNAPDNVPFFMAGGTMWVSIQGTITQMP